MAFFLSLVMIVSVFAGTGVQMQAASSNQVIYFNNSVSDWSNVYAYVWGSGLTTKAIKGTKVADNIYKMEIPESYSNILLRIRLEQVAGINKQRVQQFLQMERIVLSQRVRQTSQVEHGPHIQ